MTRFNATIRRAKKETATTTMMIDVTVGLYPSEIAAFTAFIDGISAARKDPFVITPEVKGKTEAAMKFDELVPADDPPEATAGPTWAPQPSNAQIERAAIQAAALDAPDYPTEDKAVAAFKKFAATHKAEESVALVKSFNVARVKELKPEQRASFIAEASRDL